MFTSLRRLCKGAIADYQVKSREEWVVAGHPSQVNTHVKKLFSGRCFFFFLHREFVLSGSVCPLGGANHLSDDVVQGHGCLLGGGPRPLCSPAGVWADQLWCRLHNLLWFYKISSYNILIFDFFFFFHSTDVCVCLWVIQRLNALAALVRGQLPALHRNIITALITIDVHARDIVTDLISQKVQYCYTVITRAEALVMCRSWFSNIHIHPICNWSQPTPLDSLKFALINNLYLAWPTKKPCGIMWPASTVPKQSVSFLFSPLSSYSSKSQK